MKKKIFGILICTLLLSSMYSVATAQKIIKRIEKVRKSVFKPNYNKFVLN